MSTTKALALQLGLARIRKLDGTSSSNLGQGGGQQLRYLFVIDFESTCWAERSPSTPAPEIIEFPVVLLCLASGKVLEEFHQYVMPVERPQLSPFCTQLTGITQDMVEEGVPLPTCLMLFSKWMERVCTKYSISMGGGDERAQPGTCCTWSDWDLNLCLENECRRKQVRKPDGLDSWVDIRAVYREFYKRRPQGLNGALKELGLNFEGREHSGIQDARNTAKLVWKMVSGGCKLEVTGTTVVTKNTTTKKTSEGYVPRVFSASSGVKIGPPPRGTSAS
jgi:ERI1 exoribonuclease 2